MYNPSVTVRRIDVLLRILNSRNANLTPNYVRAYSSEGKITIGNVSKEITSPKKVEYVPRKYLTIEDVQLKSLSQSSLRNLRWMMQKDILGQDMFLLGRPGPSRRKVALQYLELTQREVEYVALSRDTTEADLKQRREIQSSTAKYFDQSAVRAAVEGRVLVIEGIEKAERNVLPVLNNLLENREMHLEDGRFLIPASRYDKLLEEHGEEEVSKWRLVRVDENFRVIALGLPVPRYSGQPLDPPLRSRFQARDVATLGFAFLFYRTHSKESSYACLYCGQTFVQKSKLTYHIRKHTGENLESCPVCSKLFTSACSLREHMKTHVEKKQIVKCPLCDKGYQDERYMLRHLRTLHSRAQFSCPLCHKLLSSAAGLRHHVITHSCVNTFQCKSCTKSYAVKRTMLKHLRKRHGLTGNELNIKDYFTRLEPRECQLDLDETTMTSIFGPPKKKMNDILIGDFVTLAKNVNMPEARKETDTDTETKETDSNDEEPVASIKEELHQSSEDEIEPTDFVSVKIENIDEDYRE